MPSESSTIAWIFYSTALASEAGPARKQSIVAAADAMNHAIPTQRELSSALSWLKTRGLVEGTRAGYVVTARGKGLITRANARGRSMLGNWERISSAIERMRA
jgi:hypothetical protein